MPFDDVSALRRLRDLYAKQLAAPGYGAGSTYGYDGPPNQAWQTPRSAPTDPPAQAYGGGGAVDTLGGPDYEDYGSGRMTPTPAERRDTRERRIAQHKPPLAEDDWGAREWDRFGSRHKFNPLSYGMEALGRLDSSGRDSNSAADIRSFMGADHYQRSGLLSDALVDVGSLMTFGLPGLAKKAVAAVAPMIYDVGAELAPDLLASRTREHSGYAGGGSVVDIIKAVRDKFGKTQGRRAEQAADLTNLERLSEKGVYDLFDPANRSNTAGGLLAAMPPQDFENYALRIPQSAADIPPYPRWQGNVPRSQSRLFGKDERTQDNYLKLYENRILDKGLDTPASLWMYRTMDPMTAVEGHEGRHGMRALERLGEDKSLANLRPSNVGELRGGIDERLERLRAKYFPRGGRELIIPEGDGITGLRRPPLPLYSEPFDRGGRVLSRIARHVAGKPSELKLPSGETMGAMPLRELEDIGERFARRTNHQYPIQEYPEFDEARARRVAQAFEEMQHNPLDSQVRRSYEALIDETMGQYRALEDIGLEFSGIKPGDNVDDAYHLAYPNIVNDGRMKFFPTEQGFGSDPNLSGHPLLQNVGRVGDIPNATANDAFRVVHDLYGHFAPGNPFFDNLGEDRAFLNHSRMYSKDALPALASETRGQNSWVTWGPHGEHNQSMWPDRVENIIYAPQKAGSLPEWAYKDAYKYGGLVKFVKNMREFLGPEKSTALDKIGKVTDQTKNEALIYGMQGVDDPLSAITRGEVDRVEIPEWSTRFVDEAVRKEAPWFTAHTHPNNTLSPSLGDLRYWSQNLNNPMDMLIGARPRGSSLELGSLGKVSPEFDDRYDVADSILRNKHVLNNRHGDALMSDRLGLIDFSKAHGLDLPRGQPLGRFLSEMESAPTLDYIARRGVPVTMDAAHAIPQTNGALAADVYPELMNFYRGVGSKHAPFNLGYKDGGPVGYKSKGSVVADVAKKAWKTRRAEDLEKQVLELNRGKSKPSDPFISPDVDRRLQTVDDPQRVMFPGIYKDPRDLITQAKRRLVEDPGKDGAMYRLFGHTRDSLDELAQGNRRFDSFRPTLGPESEPPFIPAARGSGADISDQVLTSRNANRVNETLGLALQDPLLRNTRSWYEMSPLWEHADKLGVGDYGPYGKRALNARMGVMSAGSDPPTEISRGFLANYLAHEGRTDDFIRYGGVPEHQRGSGRDGSFPPDMMGMTSHAYHRKAHVPNLLDFETTGNLWSPKPKVPTYVAATDPLFPYGERPVADSHFSRFLGYPDVRTATTQGVLRKDLSGSEYSDMFPWWNSKVADHLDLRSRDAQALMWNVGGPQTGVSYIGPSKLEMISDFMEQSAGRLGVSPETARDLILTGKTPGFAGGGTVEDDMGLWGSQNYAEGGSVDDDMLGYATMHYDHGGTVAPPSDYYRSR